MSEKGLVGSSYTPSQKVSLHTHEEECVHLTPTPRHSSCTHMKRSLGWTGHWTTYPSSSINSLWQENSTFTTESSYEEYRNCAIRISVIKHTCVTRQQTGNCYQEFLSGEGDAAPLVKCLPDVHKALGSIPCTPQTRQKWWCMARI